MHTVIADIFEFAGVYEVELTAAVVAYCSTEGTGDEIHVSLPLDYTSDQEEMFAAVLDNEHSCILLCTMWLSDGGYIEYYPSNQDWIYHAPTPQIPAFPNDKTLGCMVNNPVVKWWFTGVHDEDDQAVNKS